MRIVAMLAAVLPGLALAAPLAVAADSEVHRWYDHDGNVHYTQQPPPTDALRAPPAPAPVSPPSMPTITPPPVPAAARPTPPMEARPVLTGARPAPPARPTPPPNAAADLERALDAYRRDDYATALGIIRPLAEQGEPTAQSRLAGLYERGAGVEQDLVEAAHWYRRAAEGGDAMAQHDLGSILSEGRGVPRDEAEAVVWWERAAERGVVAAQG